MGFYVVVIVVVGDATMLVVGLFVGRDAAVVSFDVLLVGRDAAVIVLHFSSFELVRGGAL